jgi:opacity protein-like surface antigen
MKKNILIAAVAALVLSLTACQKDVVNPINENGGQVPTQARVKSTSDLHNTNWTYSVTTTELINNLMGTDYPCMDSTAEETYTFGLNFDGQYAHFSFPENVMAFGGDEGELGQIFGVSYEYSYDGTTHTGYLTVAAEDENGNEVPAQLEFTYDDATDVITFNLDMFYAEGGAPLTLTLNFERAE